MQTWRYHTVHGARLFDTDVDNIPELEKQGWRDSPAKLPVVAVKDETVPVTAPVKIRGGK